MWSCPVLQHSITSLLLCVNIHAHTPDTRIQVTKGMKYLVLSLKVNEQPFLFLVLHRSQWKTVEFIQFLSLSLVLGSLTTMKWSYCENISILQLAIVQSNVINPNNIAYNDFSTMPKYSDTRQVAFFQYPEILVHRKNSTFLKFIKSFPQKGIKRQQLLHCKKLDPSVSESRE